jgi:hypothetical protein
MADARAKEPSPPTATPAAPDGDADKDEGFNLPSATLGGKQFWTDAVILDKWRIQRNMLTGHYRLLDHKEVRHAFGTRAQCQEELDKVAARERLKPPSGNVVIVLHGLLRSRGHLQGLCDYLESKGGYYVINFGYASSRGEVADHAAALAGIVAQCRDAKEIYFVGHSLGNIVLRQYITDALAAAPDKKLDPRIRRVVMLGPPNNGAELATRFADQTLFQIVWGKSGQQLAEDWKKLQTKLSTPPCEFGIIAGARGTAEGYNPLVSGDDDGVVAVAETKLPGAADFSTVKQLHDSTARW